MKGLRTKFERFCLKHRNAGIPNLMLFITIGTAVVYLLKQFNMPELAEVLAFDRAAILRGQVWRLLTYIFTYDAGHLILTLLGLFCWFSLGRPIERAMGTLRFNLFYFSGVLLTDTFCMLFCGRADVGYLYTSLLLGFATLYPDAQFRLFFFIPIRAWILGFVYLALTAHSVLMTALLGDFLGCLFPLVAIGNYFLFFGKNVVNLLPPAWRRRRSKKYKAPKQPKTVPFPGTSQSEKTAAKTPYTHRCVVCGRTDISHPDLEFRYCSRCKGYFCYCEDHISNHNHVE